ncbi:hypothetical protein EMIHUDRAFT_463681 [Emiliania huxleyi CCMP1516]|uniref:UvrD-like helicase C-terminal domain-containing protein n=2 Tax=Emiliania huxleyi TaxID=2903 RepID=A0A0D3JFD2_EMIH1|nr:hypothetical protein EMIHUDRAFT_463681 [Emiliania huxleyi CCMP1516]EOD22217.1 hypothetical protein EMIHUDRAFT_463681 [Emiliania huxleyi CCMP1516]|eukprot:XP_005774646.1 hypothetical protein EMIHUDRAFT_463681 [Emiliania huxleyi CCMP1516]
MSYVEEAWGYGSLADSEAGSFPMGTNNELSHPGDQWHPVHSDEGGDVSVPYVIKLLLLTEELLGEACDLAQRGFHLPLLLDAHEQSLVPPPQPTCSTLLVGRSGTGKTSLALEILYRVQETNSARRAARDAALRERASGDERATAPPTPQELSAIEGGLPPHTNVLFLCKSVTLASRVKSHSEQLMLPLGEPPADSERLKLDFSAAEPELQAPLFLSSSEWLVLLDRCLPPDQRWFKSEQEEAQFKEAINGTGDGLASLLSHMELAEGDDRPTRAPAAHEHVHDASEARPLGDDSPTRSAGDARGGAAAAARQRRQKGNAAPEARRELLTFEMFEQLFQGHKTLRSLSAFSYIKGSREAMKTKEGYLSRDEYIALASKMSPLPAEMRGVAYDAFEDYLRKKRRHRLYDVCDVVFHLFTQVRQGEVRHSPLHRVIIDEVQDLTMAELALLHDAATDKDGLFGDAARLRERERDDPLSLDTITRGVGFRFTDVRLLFDGRPKPAQLITNYRTHSGILTAANALVSLLTKLFPTTLDRLDDKRALNDERGHFLGPPPALLPDTTPARVSEMMLAGDELGLCEMGANQVVIVRSASAKKKLPPLLQSGLVLTVEESKGLEFDDVCIFDFFADSPRECTWAVLSTLDGDEAAAGAATADRGAAPFDPVRDNILCEELKMLYVAMTRARKRCFVYDSSTERRKPLFDLLSRAGVAESGLEGLLSVSKTKSRKSSAEDWLRQADNLERNRLWAHAEKAFLKGGDEKRALEAGGRRLCDEAAVAPKEARSAAFHHAAIAFMLCASREPEERARGVSLVRAARIWCAAASFASSSRAAGFYARAGEVLRDGVNPPRLVDALSCFVGAAEQTPKDKMAWATAQGLAARALQDSGADAERLEAAFKPLSFLAAQAEKATLEQLVDAMAPLLSDFSVSGIRWEEDK